MSPKMGIEGVTLRNGFWFYFTDDHLKITAFSSGLSGKEAVFVGEDLVSNKRNYRRSNKHAFTYENNDYEVELAVESIWTGRVTCTLKKNGQVIAKETKSYTENNPEFWKVNFKELLLMVCVGAAIGFAMSYFSILR